MSTTNIANEPGSLAGEPNDQHGAGTPGDIPNGTAEGSQAGAKDQAKAAAGTAADEGKRVAGVAQDEVKNVAAEAQTQLRGLLEEATAQVGEQSKAQQGRLAEIVRTFGDDLDAMTSTDGTSTDGSSQDGSSQDGQSGMAAQLVQQLAGQARGLASRLEDREPRELLDDVRTFARQRPGTFLLGALAAGVVAGRLTRGAKASQDSQPAGRAETVELPEAGIPSSYGGPA